MKIYKPETDLKSANAASAAVRAWLITLAAWLRLAPRGWGGVLNVLFAARINECATLVRRILVARAYDRVRLRWSAWNGPHPEAAPAGFRHARVRGGLARRYTRAAMRALKRGDMRQRIALLRALLAKPERAIARTLAVIVRGLTDTQLVPVAPRAQALVRRALAPIGADSS